MRTDLPLTPIPFAERIHSAAWDSFTPKPRPKYWPSAFRKFSDDQVLAFRRRYEAGTSAAEIARAHGVSPDTIWRLCAGKTYRDVSEGVPA